MVSQLLNPGAWLICMFHRFDADWDAFEKQVISASKVTLSRSHRLTSGVDFPETNPENKLRVSIFVQN